MSTYDTLPDAIKYFAEITPNKTCLIDGVTGERITYAEFWLKILKFAAELRDGGMEPGDRFVLHTRQSIAHLVAFYGVQVAGGIAIPIERAVSKEKLDEMTEYFDADFLQTDLDLDGIGPIAFKGCNAQDVAAIICTTGSTGKPKGVMSSYRCRFSGADNVRYSYEITGDDVALVPQALSHSGGLRRVEAMLVSGAAAVIMGATMMFGNIFGAIKKYNVTIFQLVPAQVAQILKGTEKLLAESNNRLRILSVGSAAIPESHKEQLRKLLPDVRLFNDFGSTEAIGSAYFEWSAFPPKINCVGTESLHSKIVFLDDDGNVMQSTSRDNPGTIATGGDTIMSGYYNMPELTARALADNLFVSADLGYRGDDGMIYILGRKDDMIVSGANKISPYEIEDAANAIDGVKECAVVAKPDPIMGSIPALFVVLQDEASFSPVEIQTELTKRLERFKVPKPNSIVQIDKLPRSDGTGKILRKEIVKLL